MLHYINGSEQNDPSFAEAERNCAIYWDSRIRDELGGRYMGDYALDDYEELKVRYARSKDRVKELEKRVAELEARVASEGGRSQTSASVDYDDDRRRKRPKPEVRELLAPSGDSAEPVRVGRPLWYDSLGRIPVTRQGFKCAPGEEDSDGNSDDDDIYEQVNPDLKWVSVVLKDNFVLYVRNTSLYGNAREGWFLDPKGIGEWQAELDAVRARKKRSNDERSRQMQPRPVTGNTGALPYTMGNAGPLPFTKKGKVKPTNLPQPTRGDPAHNWVAYWRQNEVRSVPRGVIRLPNGDFVMDTVEGHLIVSYRSPPRAPRGMLDTRRRDFVDKSAALFQGNAYEGMMTRGEIPSPGRVLLRLFDRPGPITPMSVASHYARTGVTIDMVNRFIRPWAQSYVNAHTSTALPYGNETGHGALDGLASNTVAGGQAALGVSSSAQQNSTHTPFSTLTSTQAPGPSTNDDPMVIEVRPMSTVPVVQVESSSSLQPQEVPPPPSSSSLSSSTSSPVAVSPQEEPAGTSGAEGNSIALPSSSEDVSMI